ncbi:MAG: DNA topoisomerase VI subunit B [Candidatus Micrarchaeota archaeon]|nr:DNA topoisomerase VI subunit B [Candidatus Micrarchaeota archaeon]
MAEKKGAEEIFKEFKEHSISEFFRKNRQMLGYAGKVRSLTTVIHEYVTNTLDACEEAGILPEVSVKIKSTGEERYLVIIKDNGPGIPKKIVGKALANVLSGTKFHRYMQQRGQQGIGAAGCTLFSQITTGKHIHVKSGTGKEAYECDLGISIKDNKPVIENLVELGKDSVKGVVIEAEFGGVKYENGDHGVYEYLKRTALVNPHISIKLIDPDGKDFVFPRSVNEMPKRPKQIQPHPLGIESSDLLDFAHITESQKLSSFLVEAFARVTPNKVNELRELLPKMDFAKSPRELTWDEAQELVNAFKKIKWIAPDMDSLSTIGEKQIEAAIKNILNPEFQAVVERKPKVFRGGIPFVVEIGIAYGGNAGKVTDSGPSGNILRFANKVPLLFDGGTCAITESVRGLQWKRYNIDDFEKSPISILVSVSSVYIPYAGVGKQSVAQEEEIIEEVRLAVMDALRILQRYLSGVRNRTTAETKYKTIMRYVSQLSADLGELTGMKSDAIEASLKSLIDGKYKKLFEDEKAAAQAEEEAAAAEEKTAKEEEE